MERRRRRGIRRLPASDCPLPCRRDRLVHRDHHHRFLERRLQPRRRCLRCCCRQRAWLRRPRPHRGLRHLAAVRTWVVPPDRWESRCAASPSTWGHRRGSTQASRRSRSPWRARTTAVHPRRCPSLAANRCRHRPRSAPTPRPRPREPRCHRHPRRCPAPGHAGATAPFRRRRPRCGTGSRTPVLRRCSRAGGSAADSRRTAASGRDRVRPPRFARSPAPVGSGC